MRVRGGRFEGALPRPIRGPELADGGERRRHWRRFVLWKLGLDVMELPFGLRQLALESRGELHAGRRTRLVQVLVERGFGSGRIGLVLQVLGDAPLGSRELSRLVRAARVRSGRLEAAANFSVLRVTPHWTLLLDVDGSRRRVDLGLAEVRVVARFRAACVRQALFEPSFVVPYAEFRRALVERSRQALAGLEAED